MLTLENSWFAIFAPPDEVVVDAAAVFLSKEFGEALVAWGVKPRVAAGEAHWQLGVAESHGGACKFIYEKLTDELPAVTPEDAQRRMSHACGGEERTPEPRRRPRFRSRGPRALDSAAPEG